MALGRNLLFLSVTVAKQPMVLKWSSEGGDLWKISYGDLSPKKEDDSLFICHDPKLRDRYPVYYATRANQTV